MVDEPATSPSLLIRIRDRGDQPAWSQFVHIYQPLIGHLMSALATLRSLYRLQVILLVIMLGLLVVVFCVVAGATRLTVSRGSAPRPREPAAELWH